MSRPVEYLSPDTEFRCYDCHYVPMPVRAGRPCPDCGCRIAVPSSR